jgi:hypothetical protein
MKSPVAKPKSYRNTTGGHFNPPHIPWSKADDERRQAVRAIGPAPEWMKKPLLPLTGMGKR